MISLMTPEENKRIEKLAEAINFAYDHPGRLFWRGLLWGLGRGIGNVIGLLVFLAIIIYLFKVSGLDEAFQSLVDTLNSLRGG